MTDAAPNISAISAARRRFHEDLLKGGVLCLTENKDSGGIPSNADSSNALSIKIARGLFDRICTGLGAAGRLAGQRSGSKFEQITREFIASSFGSLAAIRPGKWDFAPKKRNIAEFEQYAHLAALKAVAEKIPDLEVLLGSDYLIAPDVLVVRYPEPDDAINRDVFAVDEAIATLSPLRASNNATPLLHASISCKWTLRSDRAQNARSEALNLLRNRKGRAPHIAVVTGEPLPSRLSSIALGTGDIDCVYHFALPELLESAAQHDPAEATSLLKIMVDGKRLRDIADLPLDLAV